MARTGERDTRCVVLACVAQLPGSLEMCIAELQRALEASGCPWPPVRHELVKLAAVLHAEADRKGHSTMTRLDLRAFANRAGWLVKQSELGALDATAVRRFAQQLTALASRIAGQIP